MGSDWYTLEMDHMQNTQSHKGVMTHHFVFLLMLLCVIGSLFVPVWQQGIHRSLEVEYERLLNERKALEEKQQVLRASISQLSMPESLVDGAWRQDIQFLPIEAQDVVRVARGI